MTPIGRIGRIEIVTGPMFSGKGEELDRRIRRALQAGQQIRSYVSPMGLTAQNGLATVRVAGRQMEARPIERAEEILRTAGPLKALDLVAVDDVHFLGAGLVEIATHLAEQGVRLVLAGTDTDFRGEPFGTMGHLLAIAEDVTKLTAICTACGAPATRTQRMIDGRRAHWGMPVILPGGTERYQPRCRACFVVPRHDEHQVELL